MGYLPESFYRSEDVRREVLQRVVRERARQDRKWGEQNHDDTYWLGIAMEEVGEVAKGLIDYEPDDEVDTEIIQTIAVLVSWLEARARRQER